MGAARQTMVRYATLRARRMLSAMAAPAVPPSVFVVEERRDWQVTAPYLAPHRADREPWGTHHVKLEGSLVTACGQSAVAWPVFWGRDFDGAAKGACPRCAHVVRIALAPERLASA